MDRTDGRVRARVVLAAVLATLGAVSCLSPSRPTPSRPACPAPRVNVRDWSVLQDESGVRFRLPRDFIERPHEAGGREWALRGDFQQYVMTGLIRSSTPVEALGRAPGPGMMEMMQCIDSVDGQAVLVQAWRTRDGTFRNGRRLDRYDVFAVVALAPSLRFYLASGGYERSTQDFALAAVRTLSVPR